MEVRYLNDADVGSLVDMPLVIETMREAFRQLSLGHAHNVPRSRAKASGIILHSMSAAADYLGVVGWKQYTTTRTGALFHVGIYDQETGAMRALIEADRLGRMRTGAVTGLAIDLLAAENVEQLGLIGTGRQAETQLRAALAARTFSTVSVFSRDATRRREFCRRMAEELDADVDPVDSADQAVREKQVVITATNSDEPVLEGRWLTPSALVCAIGSNSLGRAELDVDTLRRADLIVCDDVECCRDEAGDFVAAIDQGLISWSDMRNLADVIVHPDAKRAAPEGMVVFKSVGLALEDVALAAKLLELAEAADIGRVLRLD